MIYWYFHGNLVHNCTGDNVSKDEWNSEKFHILHTSTYIGTHMALWGKLIRNCIGNLKKCGVHMPHIFSMGLGITSWTYNIAEMAATTRM